MEYYRSFNELRINELTINRIGFWRPYYELTDGQFVYGRINYFGLFRRVSTLEIANRSWTIRAQGIFNRALSISLTDTGDVIGEVRFETWSRNININLLNSFSGVFTNKKLLSKTFTMITATEGDIFVIDPQLWKMKRPFLVQFDQLYAKRFPDLPLLILLGVHLALLRQQQAAAAH